MRTQGGEGTRTRRGDHGVTRRETRREPGEIQGGIYEEAKEDQGGEPGREVGEDQGGEPGGSQLGASWGPGGEPGEGARGEPGREPGRKYGGTQRGAGGTRREDPKSLLSQYSVCSRGTCGDLSR